MSARHNLEATIPTRLETLRVNERTDKAEIRLIVRKRDHVTDRVAVTIDAVRGGAFSTRAPFVMGVGVPVLPCMCLKTKQTIILSNALTFISSPHEDRVEEKQRKRWPIKRWRRSKQASRQVATSSKGQHAGAAACRG